jgi:hypothetical protein
VLAYDGEFYHVRLIGDYFELCPDVPIPLVEDTLTATDVADESVPPRRRWNRRAAQLLMGRTIKNARYMTRAESDSMGWTHSGVLLHLDNGTDVWPGQDDEGNGPGALHGFAPDEHGQDGIDVILPVCNP